MLILDAIIRFDTREENEQSLGNDLSTSGILRLPVNLGDNDNLFTGTLIADKEDSLLIRGIEYSLLVEMRTVTTEAYNSINHLVKVGNEFTFQAGCRTIGHGRILDFIYYDS